MAETKWTPGPWKTDSEVGQLVIDGVPVPVYEVFSDSDACWIAQVLHHRNCTGSPGETGKFNARLIAAAPALYEALRDIMDGAHAIGRKKAIAVLATLDVALRNSQ